MCFGRVKSGCLNGIGASVIYLVRQGQTQFNLAGRHHGHVDSPLTELGRDQARGIGQALAVLIDPNDTAIYSSPLGRAVEIARILSKAAGIRDAVIMDADLMEIGMGSGEGSLDLSINCCDAAEGSDQSVRTIATPCEQCVDESEIESHV